MNTATFENNHAEEYYGGVAYLEFSTFTARKSTFRENSGERAGVADLTLASTFTAADSLFFQNEAGYSCGVACVSEASLFVALNSMFVENSAGTMGGVAMLSGESKFSARNSSFMNNIANESDVVEMAPSSVLELFKGSLTSRPNVDAVRNSDQYSRIYMALMRDLNLSTPVFDMKAGEIFLYLMNDDGSSDDNGLSQIVDTNGRGTVNVVHWTYPCGAGRVSVDGMEHSETILDIFGNSIDDNVSCTVQLESLS